MMGLAPQDPAGASEPALARTLSLRVWDGFKRFATIDDGMRRLDKDSVRLQAQIVDLSRIVFQLAQEVRELSGKMSGIEKRLDDKDKLMEATIKLRIMEETAKLRSELAKQGSPP